MSDVPTDESRWRAEDDPALLASTWRAVLPRRIAELAATCPDRPFITDVGGRRLTYGEFESELRRWCSLLRQLGVQVGDRVASLLPSSIDAHLLWFACVRVGALEVSVNRDLRGEFLHHVLTDSGARLCFVRAEDADLAADAGVHGLDVVIVDRGLNVVHQLVRDLVADVEPCTVEPADVACVIYTSGTTGPAKGVLVTWGQLSTSVGRLPRSWLSTEDTYYSPWPMFHVSGRTGVVTMADVGGRVVCRERASVSAFWSDVREHRCTFSVVSPIVALLLAQPDSDDDRVHPLRWVYAGGPAAVDFQRRFGVRALTSYGSTEMGFVAVKRWADDATAGHVGWPRPGYQVRLIDEARAEVPDGTAGKPPLPHMIMPGYLGQPGWTASAIVDGWYRTGDSFLRNADGSLSFVDRLGDTIRRFGENISAVAIETAILREPDIFAAASSGCRRRSPARRSSWRSFRRPALCSTHRRCSCGCRRFFRVMRFRHTSPRSRHSLSRRTASFGDASWSHLWRARRRGGRRSRNVAPSGEGGRRCRPRRTFAMTAVGQVPVVVAPLCES